MPVKIPSMLRQQIIKIARAHGFEPVVRDNDNDLYDKLITLNSARYPSQVKIDKVTGFTQSGELRYLKVAVHPDHYRPELENSLFGIRAAINRQTGKNRHSHSGYAGFPIMEGNDQPIGMAYQLDTLDALANLLSGLADMPGHQAVRKANQPMDRDSLGETASKRAPVSARLVDEELPRFDEPLGSLISTVRTGSTELSGLIIRREPLQQILRGEKTWEMRSKQVHKRGWIGLIEKGSGLVVAVARLVDCIGPLTDEQMLVNHHKHRIEPVRLHTGEIANCRTAWVLTDVMVLSRPVPYQHPSGAVTWVSLASDVVVRIQEQLNLAA